MNFLAIIPARYASTRFPGKPLAMIGDKPMIEHVYERVAAIFADTVAATDDRRIFDAVESFGGCAVMTSESHRSGTDRVAEALEIYEKRSGKHFDVVVNIQGDEPFVAAEHLQKIKSLFELPSTEIATLVKPFAADEDIFNPNSPKVAVSTDGYALWFSRSVIPFLRGRAESEWQQNHLYYKHIGMYAYTAATLRRITLLPQGENEKAESLEQLRWIENGYRIRVAQTTVQNVSVDTPEDLEHILKQK